MTTEATRSYNDKWNYFRSQTNLIFLTVPYVLRIGWHFIKTSRCTARRPLRHA